MMTPTPYIDINLILDDLLTSVQAILGESFLGMYLYGSLALGDFTEYRSDVDVVTITHDDISQEVVNALRAMHKRLAVDNPRWGPELEGTYMPLHAIQRFKPSDATMYPHIERGGELVMERPDAAQVIQGHILREHGITLAGPPAHTLIDPVTPDDLRQATADIVREWWTPMLDDPSRLYHSGYQVYAVLTMCRVLYTLEYGTIVSKPTAARWARQGKAKQWSRLIDWALEWGGVAEEVGVDEALGLIRYTVGRCREREIGNKN